MIAFRFFFKKKKNWERERERKRNQREKERKEERRGERIPVENSGEMARIRSGNWIRMKMRPLAKWESLFGDVTSTKVNRTFQRDWRVDSASSNFLSMKLAERTRLESRSVRGGNDFRNATRCYPPCPNFLSHVFPLSNLTASFRIYFRVHILRETFLSRSSVYPRWDLIYRTSSILPKWNVWWIKESNYSEFEDRIDFLLLLSIVENKNCSILIFYSSWERIFFLRILF